MEIIVALIVIGAVSITAIGALVNRPIVYLSHDPDDDDDYVKPLPGTIIKP